MGFSKIIFLVFALQLCEVWSEESETQDVCLQPKKKGPCRALLARYWFNAQTGKCEEFMYGGCHENANNFMNESDCEKKCGKDQTITMKTGQKSLNKCSQPQEVGSCSKSIPRFWYDKENKKCEKFTFSGCKGNENNFVKESECLKACKERPSKSEAWPLPQGPDETYNCCKDLDVASECLSGCTDDVDPEIYKNHKCIDELPKLMTCRNNNFEQSACCESDRVPSECLWFCGFGLSATELTESNHTDCEKYTASIETCAKEHEKEPGPNPPHNIQATVITTHSAMITWDPPKLRGGNIFMFAVYYKREGDSNYTVARTEDTWVKLSNLEPNAVYNISIISVDRYGHSVFTHPISMKMTLEEGGTENETKARDDDLRKYDICSLPSEVGECRAKIARIWYNHENKKCEDFFYGGCGGNFNNFRKESQCLEACVEQDDANVSIEKGGRSSHEDDGHVHDENAASSIKTYGAMIFVSVGFHLALNRIL